MGTQIGARLAESFAPMEALSFKLRLFVWMYNIQLFLKSPIFGWGPSSLTLSTITDNEYLYMARNYGIIGILAFFFLLFTFYWIARRISKRPDIDSASLAFAKGMQGGMVCFLIAGIAANNYSNHQLMSIFWALFGVLLAAERMLDRKQAPVPVSP
jgi:O-antigen ligase